MENRSFFTPLFRKFLQEQGTYKALNFDQWTSFLEFTLCVQKDLSGYDPDGACMNNHIICCIIVIKGRSYWTILRSGTSEIKKLLKISVF